MDTTPADVDLIIEAGWVLTVDDHDTIVTDGLVVVDEGVIVDVGTVAALSGRYRSSQVMRLAHHALLPGLVNSHTHLAMTMFRGFADDRDLDAFLATLVPVESAVLTAERVEVGTRAAAVESVLAGTTTALDMYFFCDAALAGAQQVGLRLVTGPVFLDGGGPASPDRDHLIDWAGRWLSEHPARSGWRPALAPHSTYLVSPEHLSTLGDLAADHDATLHIHAAETASEVDLVRSLHACRPVELLAQLDLLGERTVLAHGVHLNDVEIELVATSGASVAHCPASNMKLGSGLARVPELLAAGANVGLGTDGAASSNDLDLFGSMRMAALIHKGLAHGIAGGDPQSGGDPTDLPAPQVLRMATRGGARALGIDDAVGSIEVGKRADLVAVDLDQPHTQPVHDPVSAVVYAAGRGDVDHVWIDGRHVVDGGGPVGFDRREISADLRRLGEVVSDAARAAG